MIWMASLAAFAQTNIDHFKTISVTNWVQPGPYLRIVNGQLYNTAYSQLWGEPVLGLPRTGTDGHPIKYVVVPDKWEGDVLMCNVYGISYWWETYTGAEQDDPPSFCKTIAIYHARSNLILNQATIFHCMKVADLVENNRWVSEAYDCGIQDTNPVPIVKFIKVKSN